MLFQEYFSRHWGSLSIVDEETPTIGSEVWFTNARHATSRREIVCGVGIVEAVDAIGCYEVSFQRGVYRRTVYLMAEDLEVIS